MDQFRNFSRIYFKYNIIALKYNITSLLLYIYIYTSALLAFSHTSNGISTSNSIINKTFLMLIL